MRPVSNACSEGVGEVPDDEVNAHLGNPGQTITLGNLFQSAIGEILERAVAKGIKVSEDHQ
jgi:hypothetical protein